MPYDYFVRITHAYEDLRSLLSLWSMRCEKMVVYEHVGSQTEKIHCHLLILGSNTQKKQLRNIGATCVNLKGNEMCSFKEASGDWEGACVYMTKGRYSPSYLKGFQECEAECWKAKWKEPERHEKISTDAKLIEEFWTDEMYEKFQRIPRPEQYITSIDEITYYQFYWLVRQVRNFIFEKNGGVWNMKTRNQYYTILMSVSFRQQIPIPKKHKFAEIF